jgi:hypothetical protein
MILMNIKSDNSEISVLINITCIFAHYSLYNHVQFDYGLIKRWNM